MNRPKVAAIIGATSLVLALAACDSGPSQNAAQKTDRAVSNDALVRLQNNQPVKVYDWSQLRQNLIELQAAQANTTQTTTFFFTQGQGSSGAAPVMDCPSVGFPVATTTELTSPTQKYAGDSDAVVAQADPTGIYPGDSAGTYVICIDGNGKGYASYWEGDVFTVTGPAKWDDATHRIVLVGAPTASFSTSH